MRTFLRSHSLPSPRPGKQNWSFQYWSNDPTLVHLSYHLLWPTPPAPTSVSLDSWRISMRPLAHHTLQMKFTRIKLNSRFLQRAKLRLWHGLCSFSQNRGLYHCHQFEKITRWQGGRPEDATRCARWWQDYQERRPPRRMWDLEANRVVPYWVARKDKDGSPDIWGISHAWMDNKERGDVMTPINGYKWPVPIPKDANLDLIHIEMLNLGAGVCMVGCSVFETARWAGGGSPQGGVEARCAHNWACVWWPWWICGVLLQWTGSATELATGLQQWLELVQACMDIAGGWCYNFYWRVHHIWWRNRQ